jgi:hypothetical protein
MTLQQEEPSWLGEGDYETITFTIDHHLIIVDVTFPGGGEDGDSVMVPMALDYCASFVFLTPDLAGRLGIDPDTDRVQMHNMTVGGKITTDTVYAGVSDLSNFKQRLFRADFEGLIGASFLYPHKITIDYRRDRIYLHR